MGKAAAPTPQQLGARARELTEGGDLTAALKYYVRLEQLEPESPQWPRLQASLHQRLFASEAELCALVRCAERHARRQEFEQALATYKMILSIDPGHILAQQELSELEPYQAVSVNYQDRDAAEAAATMASLDPESDEPSPAAASEALPLDELVLTEIVPGARPSSISEIAMEGVHEIPLDPPEAAAIGESATHQAILDLATEVAPIEAEQLALLEHTPLFSSLARDALAELATQVQRVELRAGEELFHQGDAAGALYIVTQGAVVPIAEGEPRTRLAVLEPGEYLGELALLTDQPRNATIEALVDSQLLAIDRPIIWRLIRNNRDMLPILLRCLRNRLINRLVRTSELFQIFSSSKREAVAQRFRLLEVEDGRTVIQQHHPTEAVFILLAGHMEVVHKSDEGDEKVLASLVAGELFGEMSVLWREPSLASVKARGKCWLLALPAQSFQEMLDHHPQLAAVAARIARERREKNEATFRGALRHTDGKSGII